MEDFFKSVRLVLQERITSPLSGAFFFSWFVWNWRIPYTLLFPDSTFTLSVRLSTVWSQYIDLRLNLWYPIYSTLFLILVYPFATTGTLWVTLWFRRLQRNLRNKIEQTQMISLQQSIALRLEMMNQQDQFDRLSKQKDDEISLLKSQVKQLTTAPSTEVVPIPTSRADFADWDIEFKQLQLKPKIAKAFVAALEGIQANVKIDIDMISANLLTYLTSHDIISRRRPESNYYVLTEKGKYFARKHTDTLS
jgi:hypothetical protein